MQAPLSSTASGKHPRISPPPLPSSALFGGLRDSADRPSVEVGYRWDNRTASLNRMRPGVPPGAGETLGLAYSVGLAHDAGNLLGALRLYCDLLARPGVLRDEHHHYAEELQLLSRRSSALIDRLLNPATTTRRQKVGSEVATPSNPRQATSLLTAPALERSVVPEVIEQCRGLLSMIARRAVQVAYESGVSLPVTAPRETIERILVNLTKNAAEASAGGGAITLRVSRVQGEAAASAGQTVLPTGAARSRIVLSVEDQGCGMSAAAVKVLLDREPAAPWALRGSANATAFPAKCPAASELRSAPAEGERPHGLGLRVVRELVQESGGELRLKSASGCGTTVEIAWAVAAETVEWATPGAWDGIDAVGIEAVDGSEGSVAC